MRRDHQSLTISWILSTGPQRAIILLQIVSPRWEGDGVSLAEPGSSAKGHLADTTFVFTSVSSLLGRMRMTDEETGFLDLTTKAWQIDYGLLLR